jgi:hypothetical protein
VQTLWQDLRYGLRMLRNSPGFTIVAVLTLALGIGATSAVFSVVDRVLFRSLPYPEDDRLVSFGLKAPLSADEFMAAIDYVEWRKFASPFAQVASMIPGEINCDFTEQNPVRMTCARVDSRFLPTFGIQPTLGRNFTPRDCLPHSPRVALLSYGVWRSRYGGGPKIVGRSVSLDGEPVQIIGVLPAEFEMPTLARADLLIPEILDEAGMRRGQPQPILRTFGRLKPGVTVSQSRAALQPWFDQAREVFPPAFRSEMHLSVRSLRDLQMGDAKLASWVLLLAVLAVLLLASTNVANLLIARAAARQREVAVRIALGATTARLAQYALTESMLLGLTGAGLLLRSLWRLESVPLGVDAQDVVTAEITLPPYRYPQDSQRIAFFDQLQTQLKKIPGVSSVALSDSLPPSGSMPETIYSNIEIAGRPRTLQGTGGMVGFHQVTPAYFSTLETKILQGRGFNDDDLVPSQNVVILSDALARRLFSSGDALGKSMRIDLNENGPWRTIIGVAADVKNNGLEQESNPEFYIPWKDDPEEYYGHAFVILRTSIGTDTIGKWARSEVASINPTQPVTIEAMARRVSKLADRPRFNAVLLTLFAFTGVCLAAMGLFGVVVYLVAQRTREIGIRMALGATPRNILRLVLGGVARWTLAGVLAGFAGSWFTARLLQALLFAVSVHDPWMLGVPLVLLVAIAFLAGFIPARRAMRVDPMVALRHE